MDILTNMDFHRRLPSPEDLRKMIPLESEKFIVNRWNLKDGSLMKLIDK